MIWPAICVIYWTLTPPTSDFNFPPLCNDYNACIHCCGIVNINNPYYISCIFLEKKMLKLLSCAKVATIHNYNILKFSTYGDAIFVHSQVTTMRSRRLHDMYFSSCCSLVLAIEVFYGCLSNYEKNMKLESAELEEINIAQLHFGV